MKIAILSDTHVHSWSEHSRDDNGVPSRLKHCISVWKQVRKYCVKKNIGTVLFGGDLFHKRGVLYTQAYNLMVDELANLKAENIRLLANYGNHDMADRVGKVHALQALQSAGLLHTVGESGWENWTLRASEGEQDVSISAIGYCQDAKELRRRTDSALGDRETDAFTIGLFHHGFRGARVGTSLEYVVKEDADPDKYTKDFDVQFSGHYHAHQEIGTQGNAWYVGSPMEFVRGEVAPKGFLVLDTELGEMERIDLDLPKFVTLEGHEIGDKDFDIEEHVRGNFVDVVFEELPMPWEKVESTLRKLGAEGVKACAVRSAKLAKSSRLEVDATMGDKQLLEKYMEHVGVEPSERDELLRVGMQLISEVAK